MQDDDTLASGEPAAASVAAAGGHLGKYEIRRALGTGGMGVVWAAHDPDLEREVAIKLLRGERASPELRTRLLREARAMARLKHPNVLTVYEVASDAGRDFIVMEIVDGQSLDAWLRDKPPEREVWDALLGAGRGLAAAHAAGLIHRDFKPHNVLRSRDGRVLVTDFGLARGAVELAETVDPSAADSILDVQLTATGQLLGTPAYMAPEQFDGATDARTDQFGFCVTAWEALSGTRPYEGTTIEQLREAARSGTPRRDAKLPPGVRAVLARGLSPDPATRWTDMNELLAALERTRRRWPRRLAVIAPLVLVAGGLAAFFGLRGHGPTAEPCVPEQAFGSAWTPDARAAVLAKHPDLAKLVPRLDGYRTSWLTGYEQACHKTADRDVSLGCYREQRDELTLQVELLQRYSAVVGSQDLLDLLDGPDPCAQHPASRPRPADDARRGKILAFLAKAYGALDVNGGRVGDFDGLLREAAAIEWPPLLARTEAMIGHTAADIGNLALAQPAYQRAAVIAHAAGDPLTEAHARIGLLRLASDAFEPDMLPRTAYESELRDAEIAVHAAGDDGVLLAVLDDLRARHTAFADGDLSSAIEIESRALLPMLKRHDVFDVTSAASAYADFLCLRDAAGDIERAAKILDEDIAPMIRASIEPGRVAFIHDARYWSAWLRGDIAGAHAALEPMPPNHIPHATPIHGHVVDAQGHPVAGARVVVWEGEMFGDRERVYTDAPLGEITTSGPDGSFETAASLECGIIAELGDQRSVPALAKDGMQLVLGPTHTLSGSVDAGGEPTTGIEPFARIEVSPTLSWFDSIAPAADGTFTIAGVPAAAHVQLGAIGSHWPHDRFRRVLADGNVIHWPSGDTIDAIVTKDAKLVFLLPGEVHPTSLGELMKLATPPGALHAPITRVGWANATRAGLVNYASDARHAVFHDVAPGTVTVCAYQIRVICKTTTAATRKAPLLDGRHWPSGTVLTF